MTDYLASTLSFARKDPPLTAAAAIALLGALALASVYYVQYVMLIAPCPLCLEQRIAYYVCVPLAAYLWLGAANRASRKALMLGFVVIAGVMLWNTALSTYHAGVEYKFWPGPTDCTGPIDKFGSVNNMLDQLQRISLVRCDQVSWSLLGISLAGYDAMLSLVLTAVAGWGAKASFAGRD
jgi:disulfide bond formation protein DsbB